MNLPGIVTLKASDEDRINALADMAGESFMEEFMTQELLSVLPVDYAEKLKISRIILRSNLAAAVTYEGACCTEDDSALAIAYLKSDLGSLNWEDVESQADTDAINSIDEPTIREALLGQLQKMEPITNFGWQKEFADPSQENPSGNFVHFCFLAVDKNKRGTGAFRRLVNPYLDYADEHSFPCFLETYSDSLERLYEHFGFKTVKAFKSPTFRIYERCMMRPPQTRYDVPAASAI